MLERWIVCIIHLFTTFTHLYRRIDREKKMNFWLFLFSWWDFLCFLNSSRSNFCRFLSCSFFAEDFLLEILSKLYCKCVSFFCVFFSSSKIFRFNWLFEHLTFRNKFYNLFYNWNFFFFFFVEEEECSCPNNVKFGVVCHDSFDLVQNWQ